MNLILFEAPFEHLDLSADDPRTLHILTVLRIIEWFPLEYLESPLNVLVELILLFLQSII